MKILIQAMEAEVTQEELRANLPKEVLAEVEGKVVYPYVIAEEGESKPRVLGAGAKTLTWPRATIRRLSQIAKKGTKLFVGHNRDSSHTNRNSVGGVIGTYTREVKGKLQALAVTVLDTARKDLDVCSIEADVAMSLAGVVGDITKLTGIALGSSNTDSPAFPGAKRMGRIQCFGDTKDDPLEKEIDKDKEVKYDDVVKAIRDLNIWPSQVFSEEQMKSDKKFGKLYTDLDTANESIKTLNTKITDSEKSNEETVRKGQEASAKKDFEKLIPEGATAKQKEYLLSKFDSSKVKDLTEEGLKKEVTSLQKDYADNAKLFGVTEDNEENKDNNEDKDKKSGDAIDDALSELLEE